MNPAVAAIRPATATATVTAINHDLAWILLGFAIFTTYVLILVTQTNTALFLTFLFLWVTLIVLCHRALQRRRSNRYRPPQQRSRSAATSA